jgi:hypothetical protein
MAQRKLNFVHKVIHDCRVVDGDLYGSREIFIHRYENSTPLLDKVRDLKLGP